MPTAPKQRNTGNTEVYNDAITFRGKTQLYPLGNKRIEEGKTYRYVKFDLGSSGTNLYQNAVAFQSTNFDNPWLITMDGVSEDPSFVVGITQGIPEQDDFGWILTKGVQNVFADFITVISKGEALYADPAFNFIVRRLPMTFGTITAADLRAALERPIGWCLNKTGSTVRAWIDLD